MNGSLNSDSLTGPNRTRLNFLYVLTKVIIESDDIFSTRFRTTHIKLEGLNFFYGLKKKFMDSKELNLF